MITITLDLPDDLAATLQAMPADERNHFATAALSAAINDEDDEENKPPVWTQEDLDSIGRGLADADAGRFVDAETVFANLRKRVGLPEK
jgi:predicted transcriptional regulator